ncbi:alkaline phosphatase family protein [Urbifossiella limnaea]|uniref:Alkaline phosphatase PhoV n=1 Tax=Urbifossiella limnaea TaxID=2528023 RepID=A0A517XTD9_9BACT|nr:alkaline phosphatase family protein [Urbifossiella limnaea]QDU20762.1 Alkaline phosphatase PhoV precursor [Urbifossiella limnaea]
MRRVTLLIVLTLLVVVVATSVWYFTRRGPAPNGLVPDGTPTGPGRLVVVVVFDQFRGDYLAHWAEHFGPDGFARLQREGVWYADAHFPYACTSTGPGHASIATGAPPSAHGVVENDWYDRKAAARVYCAQPDRAHDRVPPLLVGGQPARGSGLGFGPDRVMVETLADRLRVATGGKGRVVVLSIKDRSAAMLGGKQPDAAYCFDTRDGRFHTGSNYRPQPHPWVEEFNASGTATRWVGKTWERLRPDLNYDALAGKDDAPGEGYGAKQGRKFPHPMSDEEAAGPRYFASVETSPFGNELLLELAKQAVTAEKLGNGEAADLLCLSFSSNDLVGHQWGPDSHEVLDITLRSDRLMADLLTFLDTTVGKGRHTVVVTADHGICPIPEGKRLQRAERLSVNALLPGLPAALDEVFGPAPTGLTRWLELDGKDAQQVWPWVYLNHAAIRARGADLDKVADFAAQWLGNRHNSQLVAFTRKQIETGTLPPGAGPELRPLLEQVKLAYHADRCGDIIVIPQPGVLVTGYAEGTSHGSPHPYDTHVPVLAAGQGVPALGKQDRRASALLVAPIAAKALGISPPEAAREPLTW